MKRKRISLVVLFAALSVVPLLLPQPGPLKEIVPGVWFRDMRLFDPLQRFTYAAREWAGLAVYRLFGVY